MIINTGKTFSHLAKRAFAQHLQELEILKCLPIEDRIINGESIFQRRTFIINDHCAVRHIYILVQKKEQYYIFSFYSDCARHTIITINYLMQCGEKFGQILFMVFVWAYPSFVDTGKSLVILQFLINIFESTNLVRGSSDWIRMYGVIQMI